jgi:hypothetical protein
MSVEIGYGYVVIDARTNEPVPCLVREKRRTMSEEEFWDDVFGQPDPLDEAAELDQCFGISAPNPCPECGSVVACGYDSEGRPMIHVVEPDE